MVGVLPRRWLLIAIVCLAIAAGSTATVATASSPDSASSNAGVTFFASCTASPTEVNVGETVTLDASASDSSYLDFDVDGDGEYERLEQTDFVQTVSYFEPGTYEPQVRDAEGNVESCGNITVNEPPNADFTFSPNPGVAGQPIEFDASASSDPDGEIVRYNWDWNGDEVFDETTTEPTINHTYFESGFEDVILRVDDDSVGQDFTGRDVEVVDPTVIARCSVEPTTATVGEPVLIDARASENVSYLNYDVNGDGEYDYFERTELTLEHVYEEPGEYVPIIEVVGPTGQRDIEECGVVTVEPENEPPEADFTYDPQPGIAGQAIEFDASASTDPDGTIDRYEWDFDGDGDYEETTTDPVIEHTYFEAGFENVALRVRDDQNATGFTTRDVEIVEPTVVARCSVEPTTVTVGESVLIDARASENASYLDYDVNGDTEFDFFERTEFALEHVYEEPGEYTPIIRVYGPTGQRAIEECGVVTVEPENEPPEADFTYDPQPGIAGQAIEFDASASTDPDGTIDRYEWDFDGDGDYEETTTDPVIEHTYFEAGFENVALRVRDDQNATGFTTRDVEIVEPSFQAVCTVEPTTVEPGETVTIQVSDSGNVSYMDYDFDGDGEYDLFETTEFTVRTSYNETGTYTPLVRVYSNTGSRQVIECGRVTVEQPPDEDGLPPWWPIPAIGGGLLGLGGLGYYLFGGGGGAGGGAGGGGGSDRPKPKPKPRPHGSAQGTRYETGVFELPRSSGPISVPVGFEPDLVLFSAANGARTDSATDRTAGWSHGIAHRGENGMENQCLTVADDAHATDQATCAVDDDLVIQVIRHEADSPPGRVTARVTGTTSDGFEVDVSVPGDDPLAGGIRVLYRAFRTGSDVDFEVGTMMTATEPGTQTVELGIDADHVSLSTSAAVSDEDQLWTTDRGVGASVGYAVADPESPVEQVVAGTSVWPGTGHPTAGVADDAAGLHLLYQDGDRLAGRTSASVTALGETLRLQYARAYNGPHKLGSTARHPISYLALAGGETMRPTVGTFSLPRPKETRTIDCGFEPAMVELTIAPAPLGKEVATGATAHPFGWSQGTAIATGERLRQYVLHHAVVPEQPAARAGGVATDAAGTSPSQASTDGGRAPDSSGTAGNRSEVGVEDTPEMDVQPRDAQQSDESVPDTETGTAPAAAEHADDERAGLWLARDPDGTIVGRDELGVTGVTETGFQATVESVDTDRRGPTGVRPTVVYRAWPAVDVTGEAGERTQTEPSDEQTTGETGAPDRTESAEESVDTTAPFETEMDTSDPADADIDLSETSGSTGAEQ
ncbi:MAG: PKD domain-containing protein [Halapricum sp.]